MGVWKHGVWKLENMGGIEVWTCRYGNWRYGNLKTWRYGSMGYGNMKTWRCGNWRYEWENEDLRSWGMGMRPDLSTSSLCRHVSMS